MEKNHFGVVWRNSKGLIFFISKEVFMRQLTSEWEGAFSELLSSLIHLDGKICFRDKRPLEL